MNKKNKIILAVCIVVSLSITAISTALTKSQNPLTPQPSHQDHGKDGHKEGDGHQDHEKNTSKESNGHKENHEEKQEVKLSEEQLKRFDIQTIMLTKNHFQHRITLPGQIAFNENNITHVVALVPGIVKEIFKGLGETVKADEALATLQSREMAEVKSSYISAHKNLGVNYNLKVHQISE